ncbi:hypothetical protein K431DRAFT_95289 [Polychaeton citri CBS 116435]|uniref:Uncharacterized protein n=1 Tax=Polychaeton citri CBS 116435 TaxID=1314669 RepID=A0A9P4Q6R3_9PEZI|nr:hypothetical protein K431DRAFT_95289 [Polychaeton citri CBS 116435]
MDNGGVECRDFAHHLSASKPPSLIDTSDSDLDDLGEVNPFRDPAWLERQRPPPVPLKAGANSPLYMRIIREKKLRHVRRTTYEDPGNPFYETELIIDDGLCELPAYTPFAEEPPPFEKGPGPGPGPGLGLGPESGLRRRPSGLERLIQAANRSGHIQSSKEEVSRPTKTHREQGTACQPAKDFDTGDHGSDSEQSSEKPKRSSRFYSFYDDLLCTNPGSHHDDF